MPIIDAGIAIWDGEGEAAKDGVKEGVFIMDADGKPLTGKVWPEYTHFVDFFHPKSEAYWAKWLDVLYDMVNFDGIWLDMNEAANFCDGQCTAETEGTVRDTIYNNLPYYPGGRNLEKNGLSMDATHYGGKDKKILEYDVHNYFGLKESVATYNYLKTGTPKHELPFILSRSTSAGSGSVAAHWNGDNAATWKFLRVSIQGMLNLNMFGVPHVGSDLCGFLLDTHPELCARWAQVGVFYPFVRNHNNYTAI